jgi:predicted aldo/keto reductase-like oxidoreductase
MYEFDTALTTFNPTKERLAYEETLLPVARRQGLGIIAMKTMGGATRFDHVGTTGVPGVLVGEGAGKSTPENLLRYALSLPLHTAICGMRDYAQLRQNLALCYNFQPLEERRRRDLRFAMNDSDRFLAYNKPGYARA